MNIKENGKFRFKSHEERTMDDVTAPFTFIVKKEVSTGKIRKILDVFDVRNCKDYSEIAHVTRTKLDKYERKEGIDNETYYLDIIKIEDQKDLRGYDLFGFNVKKVIKKLNIPEESSQL